MEIKGKTALITGAARIGAAVGLDLAKRGCHLVVVYRESRKKAEEVCHSARSLGVKAEPLQADLQNEVNVPPLMEKVKNLFGSLDILINMASSYDKTPLASLNHSLFKENIETNLQSAYLLSLAAAKLMKKQGRGRIINFSDWIAASGRPRYKEYLPYYVSKSGIIGLTEGLALELAPDILVNTIAPGPILPPPDLSEKEKHKVQQATPLKRWGSSEEISKAVRFLIESDFVTGECIRVDGGRHLY